MTQGTYVAKVTQGSCVRKAFEKVHQPAEPEELRLVSGPHMVESENRLLQVGSSDLPPLVHTEES